MRSKHILFFLPFLGAVLLHPLAAGAGSIHGVVKSDSKPLTGATVRVLELDRADHTDAKGEFTFRDVPNGTYRIFVRMLGYATATNTVKVADNTTETTFSLKESAIENEDVVITASPYARPVDEQYQSSESKAQVELHQSPGASFAEEISDMPGVDVRWNGSAPARPMLRGLSDNEVLVLENGLRIGDISTFDPAHSVPIEPLGVSQIDIVRGPASIMYGPNAIGGLVNVITNTIPTVSSTPFSGTASVGLNSVNDGYSGYFNGVYSNGGNAFSVTADGTHTQDIHIPEANYFDGIDNFNLSRIPQSWDHSWEGGFGYSYQGDLGMIGIGYKYYGMTYGIPGTPPNNNWTNDPPATSLIEQEKNSVELRALFPVNGAFIKQIKFNGNYAGYWHSEYPTAQDSTGVSDPQANHFNLNGINASLQLQHEESSSLHGTFGVWLSNQNLTIEGDQPLGPNSTTTDVAGYLFEEYQAGENTRLQAAARFDYNHIQTSPYAASTDPVFQTLDTALTSSAVTASIGALQKLGDEMMLSLNIGRSFRAPTVQELFANGLDAASSSYSIGDASLVPETGLGFDLSLKGTFDIVSIELSPYVNFINNYIYSYFTGADSLAFPIRQFAQTDARLAGFEASAVLQLAQTLGLKASVSYVNAEQTKDSIVPLPFIPPMHGLLALNYQDNTYSGVIEWRLAAAQNNLGTGDTYTAGYGIVNIGAGIRLPQDGMVHNISIRCDNVFDLTYRDNLSVIKDFLPQPGRGFRLAYDLLF